MNRTWWCAHAWLPKGPAAGVRISSGTDGTITAVETDTQAQPGDTQLDLLVLPGFANTHSHAFHRALRGRTHTDGGTFWTWRDRMYALADRLTPDTYCELATAVFSEMVLSGVTCVGEFHYLHHGPGGARYGEPNAMGEALREAAARAGLRMTLLDTCYLRGGIDVPLEGVQRRFDDGDAESWAMRVSELADGDSFRVAAAVHSVRAVPVDELSVIVEADVGEDGSPRPLHVHLSEQPAENASCLAVYGRTPTQLLADHGVLGSATTAVHATHLTAEDIVLMGASQTTACICPSTEQDLADGIGPARELADAGAPIALGTDQHVMIDMIAESRMLEMHERLASGRRGRFSVEELVTSLTSAGHAALGWPEAGRIEVGSLCDLVGVRLDSLRTSGALPGQIPMVASASDVDTVVVGGRTVVEDGRHLPLRASGGVPRALTRAISRAWGEA
ncbi:MAG: formimidoylglutamate deiminase [Kineosporiaceae bacterium]|nr:formimidoylglutamate deiminase [Kineosporiaceae bacterium]MBK7622197.1 formimidoylglutamate deiminase [Kineosporiaceae bacterium]